MKFESSLAESVFKSKYLFENETVEDAEKRAIETVCKIFPELREEAELYIPNQWFVPAGGIWRAAGNPNKNVSFINCTNLGHVKDDLEGIFENAYKWAKYGAYGQGEGQDISLLRPKGAKVHNSSQTSTGSVSFMYIYDMILKIIAQTGRRGASLVSMIDHHPDIFDFIKVKDKPESDPSRIDTCNISVKATDAFMEAIANDSDWHLWYENKYERIEKVVKAREIFDAICLMAWKRGDPGLQFIDTWKKYSNSDPLGYMLEASNACGEIPADKDNVCMLGHINLAKYREYGQDGLVKLIKFGVKFLNACRLTEYTEKRSPTEEQRKKLIDIPRTGLGFLGLADYFIDNKLVYGSQESINAMSYIGKTFAKYAYETGYELAKQYGSYPAYNKDKIKESAYIQRLLSEGVITDEILNYQYNVQYLTCAPTGSAQIIANAGGGGIEPLFSKYYVRRERSTTNEWKEWFTFNAYVERYLKDNNLEVTKENADRLIEDYWIMSYDIENMKKIKLVAEAQKWIDSSISVTFNLPEEATVEDVKQIYIEAWRNELKGVTVYREGSLAGVLITEKNYEKSKKVSETKAKEKYKGENYIKRPNELPCDIYEAKYKDNKFIVLVGLNNNNPYEVFVTPNDNGEIDVEKYKTGIIKKIKSNHYDLIVQNGITKTAINNIGKTFDSLFGTLSRMVSMSLRHGVELPFIIDQLNKDSGFIAFEKVLSRVLKKYIKDNTISKKTCPECGSTLIFNNGCLSCSNCSYSKCE
jgi:ribonucleoside-diphosphate reductase alpha chain